MKQTEKTIEKETTQVFILQQLNLDIPSMPGYAHLNGEWWFLADDICEIFAITDVKKATVDLPLDCTRVMPDSEHTLLVNQVGVYWLAFRSWTPEARKFQFWVMFQVLPAIACHGSYVKADHDNCKGHWVDCTDLENNPALKAAKTPKNAGHLTPMTRRDSEENPDPDSFNRLQRIPPVKIGGQQSAE